MKKAKLNPIILRCYVILWLLSAGALSQVLTAQTYTFTSCGATGSVGPTQGQVNTTYGATNLNGMVTVVGQGIQKWIVPASAPYRIEATGASGGNTNATYSKVGGYGASMIGEYNLQAGDVLMILVGQKGIDGCGTSGGGGGTFIQRNGNILHAAGGGGGASSDNNAANATTLTAGTSDYPSVSMGGVNGGGGQTCMMNSNNGGGGGGYLGDGATGPSGGFGGLAFVNGGIGGMSTAAANPVGGFGGGGSGTNCTVGGGGGGGYSGGAGGQQVNYCVSGPNRTGGGGGGSYNVGINQVNSVLSYTGDGRVIITKLCNVSLQASKNPICQGESITLSTNAVSGIVWTHDGSTNTSVNVSPTSNTDYTVTGVAATGCTTSIILTVTVNPLPNLSAAVVPSVLCVGKAATITASGANTYTWSSLSVSAPSATVNPAVTTSYNYSGTNQYGCVNSAVVAVNVNTNVLGITPNTSICEGASIVLTANNAVTYTWSTGNNFASTPVSPITNTTYMASGTDIHNCVISNAVNITVDTKPNVSASASKNTICKGESVNLMASGASTYTWSGAAGTGAQVTINPPADVVYYYTVTGTSANGCTNTATVAVTVSRCSGLSKISSNTAAAKIYPNPAGSEVTVEIGNGLLNTIEVTDLTGRMVMSVITRESRTKLSLEKLSNGVYYFKIRSTENVEVIRVVKNN